MILSRHFVFIHLPKTGGTFVKKLLNIYAPPDWEVLEVIALGGHPRNDPNHPTIKDIPSAYGGIPIFGFVRNPWDWYVSWYEFLKVDGTNELFNKASDHGRKGFKETLLTLYRMELVENAQIGIFSWYFFESFGHDLDRVKFLRFERLREELYDMLKSTVGLPKKLAEAIKTEQPINVGNRTLYQDYYNEELRNLIGRKDKEIIERFDYSYSSL